MANFLKNTLQEVIAEVREKAEFIGLAKDYEQWERKTDIPFYYKGYEETLFPGMRRAPVLLYRFDHIVRHDNPIWSRAGTITEKVLKPNDEIYVYGNDVILIRHDSVEFLSMKEPITRKIG